MYGGIKLCNKIQEAVGGGGGGLRFAQQKAPKSGGVLPASLVSASRISERRRRCQRKNGGVGSLGKGPRGGGSRD